MSETNWLFVTGRSEIAFWAEYDGIPQEYWDDISAVQIEQLEDGPGRILYSENTNFKRSAHWTWCDRDYYVEV